ncbi:MAG: hypothetical protein RSA87_03465 [Malacoplasma sp.]
MNKKNSIVQIARDAKCSTAAISRYFNDGYVSAELKERIKKSIDKLGYVLSPIARLMRGQSNEIFIVCDPKELSINKNIVPVIIDNKKKEENVFVSYCDYECGNYFDCLLNIINRKPKAIIIINHTNDGEFFKFIIDYQKEANFYILGGKNNKAWNDYDFPFYFINQIDVFKNLIEKMVEGQNNICFIGVNYKDITNNLWYYKQRLTAFLETSMPIKKKETVLLKQNEIREATNTIMKMQRKGFTNFICATHTIYRAFCEIAKDGDLSNDIGFWSLSDNKKRFKLKLFIPFDMIANDIVSDIDKNITKKNFRTYYPKII